MTTKRQAWSNRLKDTGWWYAIGHGIITPLSLPFIIYYAITRRTITPLIFTFLSNHLSLYAIAGFLSILEVTPSDLGTGVIIFVNMAISTLVAKLCINNAREFARSKLNDPNAEQEQTNPREGDLFLNETKDQDEFITGPEAIQRLIDWNKKVMEGFYIEEDIAKVDDYDELRLAALYAKNVVDLHMALLEEKNFDGDIQEMNLCIHMALLSRYESNILDSLCIDGNAVIPDRGQLVYDYLVFYLTGKNSKTCNELNDIWGLFYKQTVADMYRT